MFKNINKKLAGIAVILTVVTFLDLNLLKGYDSEGAICSEIALVTRVISSSGPGGSGGSGGNGTCSGGGGAGGGDAGYGSGNGSGGGCPAGTFFIFSLGFCDTCLVGATYDGFNCIFNAYKGPIVNIRFR